MPGLTAHYYFGQEVLQKLPQKIRAFIELNKPAFNLGLQGPDLLFYYKPFVPRNKISSIGVRIHNEPASLFFEDAIERIKKTRDDTALSYLMGFACHFVLDSSLHGDISHIAPEIRDHFLLEAEMDRQIIKKYYSDEPHTYKRYNLVKTNIKSSKSLKIIYPGLTVKQLGKCMKSFVFYMKLLYCKNDSKRTLLILTEKTIHMAGYFTSMMVRKEQSERFYEAAKELCARMEDILKDGVSAVLNIDSCTQGEAVLLELFNKNFE